ncbi:acyl-CoA dehydrogenase family protein [Streptomyces sp. NPDC057638]|uniref:acyl-CoA dehydrogenase family protein n=1 Tax=Streptomyces sp. NPDC057638 TaxID=3346190 RepID=UPI0036A9E0EF
MDSAMAKTGSGSGPGATPTAVPADGTARTPADTSPERDAIRRTLRETLTRHTGPDRLRAAVDSADGYDTALWTLLAQRLGLPALALPEEYGGIGGTLPDLAAACAETGRALLPSPLLATCGLSAPLILALGRPEQRTRLLPPLADSSLTCALAIPGGAVPLALGLTGDNASGAWAGGGRAGGVQARTAPGGGWTLYGEAAPVLGGHSAPLLLVAARTGGFPRGRTLLFLVRAPSPGLTRTRLTALDETRPQSRIELRDCPAEPLGATDGDPADVSRALTGTGRWVAALLAAEAVGAAESALERTLAYVRQREQFGRPIGSFQAVQHRLADLHVRVRAAGAAAHHAARAPHEAPLALAHCLETAREVTAQAIQLHGGIGFTWEHEAHLFFKRATADELLFGPVHALRAHAAERAGLFSDPETAVRSAPGPALRSVTPVTPVMPATAMTPATPATPPTSAPGPEEPSR